MFIIDTDILSIFAKSGEISLLRELFGDDAAMTPAIVQEISAPIEYGYEFPHLVFETIKTVQMIEEANRYYHTLSRNKKLGNGECEAIAYCKSTSSIFVTNDKKAREIASAHHVTVVSLPALLRVLIIKGIRTRQEMRIIFNKMKKIDMLVIDPQVEKNIFSE